MTARRDTDRVIATWLTEIAPEGHVDYLDETLEALDADPPAAGLGKPREVAPRLARRSHRVAHPAPRADPRRPGPAARRHARRAGDRGVASERLPAPFGLAATGLVAFESGGDIVATLPDGSGSPDLDR